MSSTYKSNCNKRSHSLIFLMLAMFGFFQSMNLQAGELNVEEKAVIHVQAKAIWTLIGGFKAIDRWHPDVEVTTLLGSGKEKGDIRVLTLENNLKIVEILELYDENAMTLQYRILESPLPITNYHASLTVKNIDDKMAEIIWKSSFDPVDVRDDEVKKIISGIYISGFESLTKLFN